MPASARRDEEQGGAQPVPPPRLPLASAPRGTAPHHMALGWVRGPEAEAGPRGPVGLVRGHTEL